MSGASTRRILENIYGITATGTMDGISGGNAFARNRPVNYVQQLPIGVSREQMIAKNLRVKMIDDSPRNGSIIGGSRSSGKKFSQKKKREEASSSSSGKSVTIFASPEYVKDASLQTFMDKFFLYFRMSRSPNSAIYVIPPDSELKKMVDMRGSAAEGSVEMQKAVRDNKNIRWDKYMFVTFGNNSTSDNYRIDPTLRDPKAYPHSSFKEIRRTNLAGDVYYISFKDADSVFISPTRGGKTGNTLKFVARANNGVYIFKGSIPDPIEKIGPKTASKKVAKKKFAKRQAQELVFGEIPGMAPSSIIGGGSVNTSFQALQAYDDIYKHDHDLAAEHFCRCFANKTSDKKWFSNSDMIFNAVYYAMNNPTGVSMADVGDEASFESFMSKFKDFSPINCANERVNNIAHRLQKIYKNSVCGNNDTSTFMNAFKHVYKNIGDETIPMADVMTGFIRNNDNVDFQDIYDDICGDDCSTQKCVMINNAMSTNTLPSLVGKSSLPIFLTQDEENAENKDLASEMFMGGRDSSPSTPSPPPVPSPLAQSSDDDHDDEINDDHSDDSDDLDDFFN